MSALKNFYQSRWQETSIKKKMAIAIIGSLLCASVLYMLVANSTADYRLLFQNMELQEASEVVDVLKQDQIPFRLEDDGRTVMVSANHIYDVRLKLAGKGLPKSKKVGFEIFDGNSFGVTEFVQQVNYTRALQGELGRTIAHLAQVERATVHIARPKPSIFTKDPKPVTASVVLAVKPGRTLGLSQTQGIAYLVANAVDGLEQEQVTILDQNSRVLFSGLMVDKDSAPSRKIDVQRNICEYLQNKAQSMLDTVLGTNMAVVKVHAEVDFTKVREVREKYDPDNQVILSENVKTHKTEESYPRRSTSSQAKVSKKSAPRYRLKKEQQEDREIQYAVDKVVEEVDKGTERLVRLSIALVVDESLAPQADKLSKLVRESVGYDKQRGDTFEVSSLPFHREPVAVAEPTWQENLPMIYAIAKQGMTCLVVLILAFMLYRLLMDDPKKEAPLQKSPAEPSPTIDEDLQMSLERAQQEAVRQEADNFDKILVDVQKNFEGDMDASAEILKSWLNQK